MRIHGGKLRGLRLGIRYANCRPIVFENYDATGRNALLTFCRPLTIRFFYHLFKGHSGH